jgi:hypothetical protein
MKTLCREREGLQQDLLNPERVEEEVKVSAALISIKEVALSLAVIASTDDGAMKSAGEEPFSPIGIPLDSALAPGVVTERGTEGGDVAATASSVQVGESRGRMFA